MTTGNDPAQPTAENQPQLVEPTHRLTFVDPQPSEDLDDAEIVQAKQAAEAEGAAGAGEGDGADPGAEAPSVAPKTPSPQDPAEAGQQQSSEPVMIPKARFDEVNGRATQAEREAAYWRGVAEARGQTGQGQQPAAPQPPQPTPQERLTAIATALDALAAQFDNGEITMAEFKRQERELNTQEQAIREEALLAKVKVAPAPPAQDGNELYLDTLTADLENQHPMVQVADKIGTQAEWDFMKARAIENLVAKGIDPTQGAMGRYELRREIAQLWTQSGPFLLGERAKAQGIVLPGQAKPQGNGNNQPAQQSLSPEAQRRAAALRKAELAPPDLRSMGGEPGDPSGLPTDARLETMGDDEIGALPDSVRRKLLGIAV